MKASTLEATLKDKLLHHEPLAGYTYMKVGGPADFLVITKTTQELADTVKAAVADQLPFMVLGGGSNVLFSDEGYRGLIIINRTHEITTDPQDETKIWVDSGVVVNQLVNYTLDHSLAGLEEFLGIPGTVGGAVFNNSHHLTHLIGDYIDAVQIVTRAGEEKTLSQAEMAFAYDYSILQETKGVVLRVLFDLKQGDQTKLRPRAVAALKRRRDTQPLEFPSSGCIFKNIGKENAVKYHTPEGMTAAGYLIDKAGLKGTKIGGAMVSDVHANFIVNTGNATASDVKALAELVAQKVKDTFGVPLEREVFFISPEPIEPVVNQS